MLILQVLIFQLEFLMKTNAQFLKHWGSVFQGKFLQWNIFRKKKITLLERTIVSEDKITLNSDSLWKKSVHSASDLLVGGIQWTMGKGKESGSLASLSAPLPQSYGYSS